MRLVNLLGLSMPLLAALLGACVFDPVVYLGDHENANVQREGGLVDGAVRPDAWLDARLEGSPDGESGPEAGQVDAGCVSGQIRCVEGRREQCDGAGTWQVLENCPLGCSQTGSECGHLVPSNGLGNLVIPTNLQDVTVQGEVVLNTDDGSVTGSLQGDFEFRSAGQAQNCGGNPDYNRSIGVFFAKSLTVLSGATLRFKGTSAAALVVLGNVTISGIIDVSAGPQACGLNNTNWWGGRCPGPGGFAGGQGGGGPKDGEGPGGGGHGYNGGGTNYESGGGGGGYGAGGGNGGRCDDVLSGHHDGGPGGAPYGDATGVPLCGGSGGGAGGPDDSSSGDKTSDGGGGGGAIQVVSLNGEVHIECHPGPCGIKAVGFGGRGDHKWPYHDGGGGGGAGGLVLIQAPAVTLGSGGVISVAGGGGGGGDGGTKASGDGAPGPFGAGRAAGGDGKTKGGQGGGDAHVAGDPGQDANDGGGGGGGAAGWIRIECHESPACFSFSGILNPSSGSQVTVGEVPVQ